MHAGPAPPLRTDLDCQGSSGHGPLLPRTGFDCGRCLLRHPVPPQPQRAVIAQLVSCRCRHCGAATATTTTATALTPPPPPRFRLCCCQAAAATAAIAFIFIIVVVVAAATSALPPTPPRCHQCSAAALPGWSVISAVGRLVNWSVGWFQCVFSDLRGLDFWSP